MPVELDSLYLLTRHGWSLERTLRLLADEVNGIGNAVPREAMTAQTPNRPPGQACRSKRRPA